MIDDTSTVGKFRNILENTFFPGNSWKKLLKSGLIEFNYLAKFIFRWKNVETLEIGKIMWKNKYHVEIIST